MDEGVMDFVDNGEFVSQQDWLEAVEKVLGDNDFDHDFGEQPVRRYSHRILYIQVTFLLSGLILLGDHFPILRRKSTCFKYFWTNQWVGNSSKTLADGSETNQQINFVRSRKGSEQYRADSRM